MSFLEHLEALRSAIMHSLFFLIAACLPAWFVSAHLQEFIIRHVTSGPGDVQFIAGEAMGPLSARVKVMLAAALMLAAPAILTRLWMFVGPGLLRKEKKIVIPTIAASVGLFYTGFILSFMYMGPQVPGILLGFSTPSVKNVIGINDVMSLVLTLSLSCGLVGEVPLVIVFLAWVGIVSPGMLMRQWRIATVVILIVAAVITPGDYGITMLLVALPIVGLYLISILLAWFVTRNRKRPAVSLGPSEDE